MSQKKQTEYAVELKLAAVRRVRAGESVSAVAEELGVRRKRLYLWKDRYAELGEAGLRRQRGGRPHKELPEAGGGSETNAGRGQLLAARKRIAELERKVGSKNWNWIFSEKPCGAWQWAGSDLHVDRGAGRARRPHSGTNVRVERSEPRQILPALAGVGAATGRHGVTRCAATVALEKRFYGYRRVQRELRQRGHWVNAKRVLRLMREDNLLCLRTRRFVPATTDSRHGWRIWPNLARGPVTRNLNEL